MFAILNHIISLLKYYGGNDKTVLVFFYVRGGTVDLMIVT